MKKTIEVLNELGFVKSVESCLNIAYKDEKDIEKIVSKRDAIEELLPKFIAMLGKDSFTKFMRAVVSDTTDELLDIIKIDTNYELTKDDKRQLDIAKKLAILDFLEEL